MLPQNLTLLLARSFCAAWLLLVLASGGALAQDEPDAEGDAMENEQLREFLRGLTLDETALGKIDAMVAKLGSEQFAERYLASTQLARLPVLPRQRLAEARMGASPDKQFRIGQVLKVNTAERTDAKILNTVDTVVKLKVSGLLPELLAALEGRDLDAGWDAVVDACELTATADDLEVARNAFASETALVRAGAAMALIKIAGKEAIGSVEPLVADPEDRIKLIAANYLRSQKSRACMAAYAALLTSENFGARWDSRDALQNLTGEEFGFFASADDATRLAAIAKWKKWIAENGATAKLDFTVEEPVQIVLFNGSDLEGWKEVKGFFRQPDEGQAGWGVEGGALICYGNSKGHLRTRAAYKNYILKLEYRTPGGVGDSGVGLFLQGEDKVEPSCLEVQIINGSVGDLYPIAGFQGKGIKGRQMGFREGRIAEPKVEADGWNRMELKVLAGTVEVNINGTIVNRALGCPEDACMITLRNEGSRVEFRKLLLQPLD